MDIKKQKSAESTQLAELIKDIRVCMLTTMIPFARPWFPDGVDSTNLALLKFVPHIAECWEGPNSKMVRMLEVGISIVAGKPIGLGGHGNLNLMST